MQGPRILTLALLLLAGPVVAQGEGADLPLAELVVVDKTARTITLVVGGEPVHVIKDIRLGDAPRGHKRFQGDERTPEGRYTIDFGNPNSAYHLSLHIDYPNAADRAYAAAQGRSPGGDIFIHGQPNGSAATMAFDWTDGCIAVSDDEIELLWDHVPDGTPIEIRP